MWNREELKANREVVDQIDWGMTPEKAVETFLEWGTGWSRKEDYVRYDGQAAFYFVIYDWEKPLRATLIRRNTSDVVELAGVDVPREMLERAIEEGGRKPGVGVYAITDEIKDWLKEALNC